MIFDKHSHREDFIIERRERNPKKKGKEVRRIADQRNPKNILQDRDLVEMGSWGIKKKAFWVG